jgi:hypothetical protein
MAQIAEPLVARRPAACLALAAGNKPVNAPGVQGWQRRDERFGTSAWKRSDIEFTNTVPA